MGTTIHYTRKYERVTQEINASFIFLLDNTNAYQDQHSVVLCTFCPRANSAQNTFQFLKILQCGFM